MAKQSSNEDENAVSRDRLADLLNEDLSREYQAIISYVVYSQVLKGAEYMSIADQLETHAQQELTERHLVRTRFVRVATSFQARGDPILLWAVPFNRQGYLLKKPLGIIDDLLKSIFDAVGGAISEIKAGGGTAETPPPRKVAVKSRELSLPL
jgi:hypothetical protein